MHVFDFHDQELLQTLYNMFKIPNLSLNLENTKSVKSVKKVHKFNIQYYSYFYYQ